MSHFLAPLLRGAQGAALIHAGTGAVIAWHVEAALDSRRRRRGLLGRSGLNDGEALVLAPCEAVHTFFMKFAIDIAFAARDGCVLKLVESVPAWRVAGAFGAFATIELPAGTLRRHAVAAGDRLIVQAAGAGDLSSRS